MSRSRNADDFLKRYFDAQRHYKNFYRPRIDAARSKYKKKVENNLVDTDYLLEAQLRQYLIDSLLKALNWRLDSETKYEFPNLIPEAQIQSSQTNSTKFLDYLGLDSDNKPLLIVETKRPSSNLPQKVEISRKTDFQTPQKDSIVNIICSGLKGEILTGDWNEWLQTLRGYVQDTFNRTGFVPKRVVITNGEWLILFRNPKDSFLQAENIQPSNVLVYQSLEEIEEKYREIFGFLEYQKVLNEAPSLTIGEIAFYVAPSEAIQILHGIKLKYSVEPEFYYERTPNY